MMKEAKPGDRTVYVAMTRLAADVTEPELRAMLRAYGPVLSYVRPTDALTGRAGATVYAEMSALDAAAAVNALDGRERHGHFMTMSVTSSAAPDMEPADRTMQAPRPRRTVLAPSVRPDPTATSSSVGSDTHLPS